MASFRKVMWRVTACVLSISALGFVVSRSEILACTCDECCAAWLCIECYIDGAKVNPETCPSDPEEGTFCQCEEVCRDSCDYWGDSTFVQQDRREISALREILAERERARRETSRIRG